jgi:hypothetical protein
MRRGLLSSMGRRQFGQRGGIPRGTYLCLEPSRRGDERIMNKPGATGLLADNSSLSGRELLTALLTGENLMAAVPFTLAIVERDPLASGGCFRGDLMRGLMEVSGHFWGRHQRLYERYVEALRAAAGARRLLPREERMVFWSPLMKDVVERARASDCERSDES